MKQSLWRWWWRSVSLLLLNWRKLIESLTVFLTIMLHYVLYDCNLLFTLSALSESDYEILTLAMHSRKFFPLWFMGTCLAHFHSLTFGNIVPRRIPPFFGRYKKKKHRYRYSLAPLAARMWVQVLKIISYRVTSPLRLSFRFSSCRVLFFFYCFVH